ncbi:MAG: archaetidylserine decarboxylase [Pseudomonadota bacterium]
MRPRLFAQLQMILPHHALSRLVFWLTRRETRLAQPVMRWFCRTYQVALADAANPALDQYASFNAFFTRALHEHARPIEGDALSLNCPADGRVSAVGHLDGDTVFQAKGQSYSAAALLGDAESAARYRDGAFITVYLSPRDYHRVHMPMAGSLARMRHIPGRLFSVSPHTVDHVPGLFARNERVVCEFDTEHGPLALVLVGAINVAAIETTWAGLVTPPAGKTVTTTDYAVGEHRFERGDEMGRFNMGSTVILLLPPGLTWRAGLAPRVPLRMGQWLGRFPR